MESTSLSGRVAIVTGGTGALGSAVSRALLTRGATVISTYIVPKEVPGFEASLGEERTRFEAARVNVTKASEVGDLVQQVLARHGHIDVLVNVVGGYAWSMLADTDEKLWDSMFEMNLRAAYLCCRAVVPHMVAGRSGRIVSVAARTALQGSAGHAAYGASKAGIVALTQALADELKDEGITVNCVMPGTMDTLANRASMPNADQSRWVPTEDVAAVIAFLASDGARSVTGAAIPVFGRTY